MTTVPGEPEDRHPNQVSRSGIGERPSSSSMVIDSTSRRASASSRAPEHRWWWSSSGIERVARLNAAGTWPGAATYSMNFKYLCVEARPGMSAPDLPQKSQFRSPFTPLRAIFLDFYNNFNRLHGVLLVEHPCKRLFLTNDFPCFSLKMTYAVVRGSHTRSQRKSSPTTPTICQA